MARMSPRPFPANPGTDYQRGAECRVYEALDRALRDDYSVFYGARWLSTRGRPHDGEADFVIAHPDLGLLVLEVKGGGIRRDAAAGRWTSTDRFEQTHEIRDPFGQAKDAKHALSDKLKAHPDWNGLPLDIGHGVCFPDCTPRGGALGADAPPEIILYCDDLGRLSRRIPDMFAFWRGRYGRPGGFGEKGMRIIHSVLAQSFELRVPLGAVLREEDRELIQLTNGQFRAFNLLSKIRRAGVSGGAGTGKSLLALEKAKRLAGEGFQVLLTCFNIPLGQYLQRSAGHVPRLTVSWFHQFCTDAAKAHGIALPKHFGDPQQSYWDHDLPRALMDAVTRAGPMFDAIVVDEGQDFENNWWEPLQFCLKDPAGGILFVFYDNNQCLYRDAPDFPRGLEPIPLTENCRNTKKIHGVASRYYRGDEMRAIGPEGRKVQIIPVDPRAGLVNETALALETLIFQEGVEADNIAILTGVTAEKSALWRGRRLGKVGLTRDQDADPGKVLLESIKRFKGLERRVVILADIDNLDPEEDVERLYVGFSRARTHLIIIAKPETLERLKLAETAE
jgi:hypothetical protein